MKFNIKSRKGFTLIELLVVIGILAVLAAIAIPSVAGLIDRANVSSDKTNSNEMTNAVERFTSEYELYCQDIASGALDPSNFDSAQGRVYNVTQITDRAGIERIEKDSSADANTEGRAIYRDTKYPVNAETMQAIVENYTKTSSSTFEPKQSDMHYWYSPDCGVVVFAEPNADQDKENKLNNQIISGTDAKGNRLDENTKWIDLTTEIENLADNTSLGKTIPEGATYFDASENITLQAGEAFPQNSETGDIFMFGDYEYRYNYYYDYGDWCLFEDWWYYTIPSDGWGMKYIGADVSRPTNPVKSINNKNITCAIYAFFEFENLEYAPELPNTIEVMSYTFSGCKKLKQAPSMPTATIEMAYCFFDCSELQSPPNLMVCSRLETTEGAFWNSGIKTLPQLPNTVKEASSTFEACLGIVDASSFVVPTGIKDMYAMFADCKNMKYAPQIPSHVTSLWRTFRDCTALDGTVIINGEITECREAFKNVDMSKLTFDGSCSPSIKQAIANTGKNPTQITIK